MPKPLAILTDAQRVLPVQLESVKLSLEKEFRHIGVEFASTLDDAIENPERVIVNVVIMPHDASSWGGAGGILGTVFPHRETSAPPVFLFYPAVERTLGKPADGKTTLAPQLHPTTFARGLARIVIHEMIHVLLPGRAHDTVGLFAAEVTRSDLLAKELELDPETRAALIAHLCLQP